MSDERASLIAAIRNSPDDDTPRLVLADWFEERGDPANVARAEFIRIQIARAQLEANDIRHCELQARELRLLNKFGPDWCKSHFLFKKVRFRRGFIEFVHLHLQHFLHHRRQLLELEPVRDIRLTGFYRASDELVKRVAGCVELAEIESFTIHHQGPHKEARNNLIYLLESPHWERLKSLRCMMASFSAETRRRFERLPLLVRLEELEMPFLNTWPESPGEWFSEGDDFARNWKHLKSIKLPFYTNQERFINFVQMPFWNQLAEISFVATHGAAECFELLSEQLPKSIRRLNLVNTQGERESGVMSPLCDRMSELPLESANIQDHYLEPRAITSLLGAGSKCKLRELRLPYSRLGSEHAAAIAGSIGAANLQVLDLRGNSHLGSLGVKRLFESNSLTTLCELNLPSCRIGTEGVMALSNADLNRISFLDISKNGMSNQAADALFASPLLRKVNYLAIGGQSHRDEPELSMTPRRANTIARLENLVCFQFHGEKCDDESKRIIKNSSKIGWSWLASDLLTDQNYRKERAPDRVPAVDKQLRSLEE